jgi:hypothetical protein
MLKTACRAYVDQTYLQPIRASLKTMARWLSNYMKEEKSLDSFQNLLGLYFLMLYRNFITASDSNNKL